MTSATLGAVTRSPAFDPDAITQFPPPEPSAASAPDAAEPSGLRGATLKTSGNRVTIGAAAFKVDVSQLTSDKDRRDQRIHQIGLLEGDRYPTASFKLSEPIELGRDATARSSNSR